MAEKRIVSQYDPGFARYFASEDGVNYRGYHQEMDPVIAHVKETNEILNQYGNDTRRNKNGWRYGGSIPMSMLMHWLNATQNRIDEFARSKKLRQEFIKWLQHRDRRAFIAEDGFLAVKRR